MLETRRNFAPPLTSHTTPRFQEDPYRMPYSGVGAPALDPRQWTLETALRRNEELLEIRTLLSEKVRMLELALAKANQFANYDDLTGLPNRRLLLDRFMQASANANRHRQLLALLFFDINDFKAINDKLGHDAGDKLLQQVATRLASCIRKSDTACRYGGDEFVVLLTEIADHEHAITAIRKVRTELAAPYRIDGHSVRLTVSDGLAMYPKDAQRFNDLMQLSDRSMFNKKSGNRRQSGGVPEMNIWMHGKEKVPSFSG